MHNAYTYVIVGAGTAGHFAAESIRKHDEDGSIAIIGDEPHRPYHRPPLSKGVLTGKVNPLATYLKKGDFYDKNRIEVITHVRATDLDTKVKTLKLSDGQVINYDKCLLATGGAARGLDVPGTDLENVYTLRTLEDAREILRSGADAKHATIVGAGFISAEVATSLWSMGVKCTILMRGDYLLQRVLPNELMVHLHKEAEAHGVDIIGNDCPVAFEGNGRVQQVVTRGGHNLDSDLVVIGIGLKLNTELADKAGLRMAADGGVCTDAFMRTSAPDVWAAGDIATYEDRSFARRMRVERTESAKGQGQTAGADMAGTVVEPYSKIPLYTFHIFDLSIKVFGVFGTDDLMRIGSLEDKSAAYYSFQDDVLEGYLGFNRPYKETKLVRSQIESKAKRNDILASLQELEQKLVTVS